MTGFLLITERPLKKQIITLFLSIIFLFKFASAQQHEVDSIKNILQSHPQDDSVKVGLLAELAFQYQFIDPDTMITIANSGLRIASRISYKKGEADCIKQLALADYVKGEYRTAMFYNEEALKIYNKLNDKKGIAGIINNIAVIFHNQAEYDKALVYYKKSLTMRQEVGDEKGVAASYNNIGNAYANLGNYSEALESLLKALSIREKLNDKQNIATTLSNIANVHYSLGKYTQCLDYSFKSLKINKDLASKRGIVMNAIAIGGTYYALADYANANNYFEQALKAANQVKNADDIITCLSNLGEVKLKQQKYMEAEKYFHQSLKLAESQNITDAIASSNNGLGQVYLIAGKTSEAIAILTKGYFIAQKIGVKLLSMEIAENLSKAYTVNKNYEKALHYLKIYTIFKDSIFNDQTNQKTEELKYSYELNKKQSEIEMLEKDKSINDGLSERQKLISFILGIGVAFLSIVIFILYNNKKKERRATLLIQTQNKEIQEQTQNLKELNQLKDKTFSVLSHDLRSPVASLSNVMMLMDQQIISPAEFDSLKDTLNGQLKSVSLLLDNLLHWSKSHMQGNHLSPKETCYLEELTSQNNSLLTDIAIQKNISVSIRLPQNIAVYANRDQVDIVIRNLLSNAIKFTKPEGKVFIEAKEEKNQIILAVEDTGIGMSSELVTKLFSNTPNDSTYGTTGEKGTGIGLLICKEFIEKNEGTISVKSELGKGSIFSISLPKA